MDLKEKAATLKLLNAVIAMAGIHPDWQDKQLRDRFRDYLIQSATYLRPMLAVEPDAPWVYLARLTSTGRQGDLRQPALLSPKTPQSKVAKLLHKTLQKHGEGEQQCHACRRWGDLSLCGCLAVTFCNVRCQEQDEEHTRVCLQLEEENVVLLARSDMRHRQRANKLEGVAREKEEKIGRMKEEMARKTKKLEQARAKLNLRRRVSLVERSLAKVPRMGRGNLTVALSISKKEGVARITSLPHPVLKLWLGQLEVDPDSPDRPATSPRAAAAEPALLAEGLPKPALHTAADQMEVEPALPPAAEDPFPTAAEDPLPPAAEDVLPLAAEDPLPPAADDPLPPAAEDALPLAAEDALPLAAEDALPPATDQAHKPALLPAPEDSLRHGAGQDEEMPAPPLAPVDELEEDAVTAPAPAAEKIRPAPPRSHSRKDKRVLVDLGRAATPFSKVADACA